MPRQSPNSTDIVEFLVLLINSRRGARAASEVIHCAMTNRAKVPCGELRCFAHMQNGCILSHVAKVAWEAELRELKKEGGRYSAGDSSPH